MKIQRKEDHMKIGYQDLFSRNLGIFTQEEQERIRKTRVLIIGCGGIGGTVAIILARSGVANFTLVDFDRFDVTNMNRQICCFTDTLGQNKTEVTKEAIKKINPEAKIHTYPSYLSLDQVETLCKDADIIFPAADDFAYSIRCFQIARRLKIPALLIVPSGLWAMISMIGPSGLTAEDLFGIPKNLDYECLKEVFTNKKYKLATYFYVRLGGWQKDYYNDFIENDLSPAQICPLVWLASSIGSLEIIKYLSRKGTVVTLPKYWWISEAGINIQRLYRMNLQTLMVAQRKIMWSLFQTRLAKVLERAEFWWWKSILSKR